MGRAKGLTTDEKATIIKESGKGTDARAIAISLYRHVDTVKRFIADPSPRKKEVRFWGSEGGNDSRTSSC